MTSPPLHLRPLVLRPGLTDFAARGFRTEPAATRAVLQTAAGTFLAGYNAELATPAGTAPALGSLPPRLRGFAAEGAAMAATLLDRLSPGGGRRLAALHDAHDGRYAYLIHVGSGWALAKLHRTRLGGLGAGAPLLRWLAYDGLGFCHGFFAGERAVRRWAQHPPICAPTCDIRHQGLGRHLWFRACGDPAELARHVARLPARHHGDAWSGIALAVTYAGGVPEATVAALPALAREHRPALAQGAAFAAEAWQHSEYVPEHARTAVRVLAGVDVPTAAGWTWSARHDLDRPGATATDYRTWRLRIQSLAAPVVTGGPSCR
ncbi:DUF1702 family protein [Symbioplanes lichenis]|uniref:DUF1702 family protein n=1 Tax=Symbioplanes lichenis TaxID=1629072 RepID=UPI00273945AD|nr:DUF1702 family protein [Actinoplanes lichenis]